MIKLLVIAPYCIIPADTGGKIRVNELVRGASEQNILVTVVMPMTPTCYSSMKINKNLTLEVVPYPFILPFLLTDKPFSYLYLLSLHPGYHHFLRKFFKTFDIIQFEGAAFGDLIDHIPSKKVIVYDAHNVEYDYAGSESRMQWVNLLSCKRVYKLEKKIAQRADHILTCSGDDSKRVSELYDIGYNKFTIIPNGIHVNKETTRLTTEQAEKKFPGLIDFPQRAIFSGSDVAHNREAVRFLIESVAPQVRRNYAFIIQGQCGNRFKNHSGSNLFFDNRPGNVGTYADICTVALNPVMQGSGTSLKVLDYLAHGLAVVSTEFGMRGYEDLKKYVTLSEPDYFARALNSLPQFFPETYSAIKRYSWTSIAETMYVIYNSLLQK